MKIATLGALATILAGVVGVNAVQPVACGYQNGYQCGQGSGCFSYQLVIDCLKCCSLNCNYGGFLAACQQGCIGGGPPGGGDGPGGGKEIPEARIVELVWKSAADIRAGTLTKNEIVSNVDFIVIACNDRSPHVADIARAVAAETPIVSAALEHSEQGRRHEDPDRAS